MFGLARRLLSTSALRSSGTTFSNESARAAFDATASSSSSASALVAQRAEQPFVDAEHLPPVLYRYIRRRLELRDASEIGLPVQLRNPFLNAKADWPDVPSYVSARRQKQLYEVYDAAVLPPSPVARLPAAGALPIKWFDGTLISWAGALPERAPTSVYGTRRRMFKGHKAERERKGREKDRAERMAGMERRIADWKRADAKEKERPSLPF